MPQVGIRTEQIKSAMPNPTHQSRLAVAYRKGLHFVITNRHPSVNSFANLCRESYRGEGIPVLQPGGHCQFGQDIRQVGAAGVEGCRRGKLKAQLSSSAPQKVILN